MAAKLTRLTHKIAIQLHLVAESCTICSSRSRRLVLKLLDTPSYTSIPRNHNQEDNFMNIIALKTSNLDKLVVWKGLYKYQDFLGG